MNESVKDIIVNNFLKIENFIKIKVFRIKNLNTDHIKSNMSPVLSDDFTTFNSKIWRIGQPWGIFHPDSPHQYYGTESVYIESEHLVLDQKYLPKKMTTWYDDKVYDIPHSVGLISSIDSFGYGFYEFKVKLPRGKGLWPAVWLTCDKTWPPEIDINESYSDQFGSYKGKLETNFHFNIGKDKEDSGARSHIVSNDSEVIDFSCWWTPNFIKIYYNGHLVRQITSDKTLRWFRDRKMIIILNNGIRPKYLEYVTEQISKFHIYSVRVWT